MTDFGKPDSAENRKAPRTAEREREREKRDRKREKEGREVSQNQQVTLKLMWSSATLRGLWRLRRQSPPQSYPSIYPYV